MFDPDSKLMMDPTNKIYGYPSLKGGGIFVYELNETSSGDVIDATPNGRNATMYNPGTSFINKTGKLDKCYYFYDINHYVRYIETIDFTSGEWSFNSWFKFPSVTYYDTPVTCGMLYMNNGTFTNKSFVEIVKHDGFQAITISHPSEVAILNEAYIDVNANEWNMLTTTYGGGYARAYLNASLLQEVALTTSSFTRTNFYVGKSLYNEFCQAPCTFGSYTFNGYLDQAALWNISLDQEQITALYNSSNGLVYTSWK